MNMTDIIGYAASIAVLLTFMMRSMLPLRLIAIASNVLFLSYGYLAHIPPVLLLHLALLPINCFRLFGVGLGNPVGRAVVASHTFRDTLYQNIGTRRERRPL
jgi:hypothetical protein